MNLTSHRPGLAQTRPGGSVPRFAMRSGASVFPRPRGPRSATSSAQAGLFTETSIYPTAAQSAGIDSDKTYSGTMVTTQLAGVKPD